MSKPYYSDYVKHALRFYSRNCTEKPMFKSDADKSNWLACDSVFKKCSHLTKDILVSVYSGHDTLADEVYNASKKYKVDQNIIWDTMKDLEKAIARKRGLL